MFPADMVTGSEMDNTTNVTLPPVTAPDEPNMSWDDATWIMTASFIIFTMQSGEWNGIKRRLQSGDVNWQCIPR